MTQELIEKCLDFAEGKKGKFTILMAKKPEFPMILLSGTEKQCTINKYVQEGYTTRQIAEIMECTQPNIVEHMRQYRKGREFYDEWCEFWDFIEKIRIIPIVEAFSEILSDEEIIKYQSKNIETIEDYLTFSVTMKSSKLCSMLGEDNADTKTALFKQIRKMCHKLLTVRMEE